MFDFQKTALSDAGDLYNLSKLTICFQAGMPLSRPVDNSILFGAGKKERVETKKKKHLAKLAVVHWSKRCGLQTTKNAHLWERGLA